MFSGDIVNKIEQTIRLLKQAANDYKDKVAFACSFGAEDVLLVDLIARHHINIRVLSLDTGRLPQQTYDVMDACRKKYDLNIDIYFPDAQDIEQMIQKDGVNLFYDSIEKRKSCCFARKIGRAHV